MPLGRFGFGSRLAGAAASRGAGRGGAEASSSDAARAAIASADVRRRIEFEAVSPTLQGMRHLFDAIADCYADLAGHIFAAETGLSSDPAMNWRLSQLEGQPWLAVGRDNFRGGDDGSAPF